MVPSMHCYITLFIVTIVEVQVLIYDDFVCKWRLPFWVCFIFFTQFCNTVNLMLQVYTANVLLIQHNR